MTYRLLTISKVLLFAFVATALFMGQQHQKQQKVQKKKIELDSLRNEIKSLEAELRSAQGNEKKTYDLIEKSSKQMFLINKLIAELRNEQQIKDMYIDSLNSEIESMEVFSSTLKANYEKYVVAVYKGLNKNKLSWLINSESLHQAMVRYRYLKSFSDRGKNDLLRIKETAEVLNKKREELTGEKSAKEGLIDQKKNEEKLFESSVKQNKDILKSLRADKQALQSDLQAKKLAEQSVASIIDRLNREDEQNKVLSKTGTTKTAQKENKTKKETSNTTTNSTPTVTKNKKSHPDKNEKIEGEDEVKETPKQKSEKYPDVRANSGELTSFSALKSKLPYPVQGSSVFRRYGESYNSKLNTTTVNYGVDFKCKSASNVMAVCDGVVSAVEWIPGYGSVVIVNHKDGYRTVYGHIAEIYVNVGKRINSGDAIGKVNESLEGFIFHFEIWKQRSSINPESWFRH